MGYSEDYFEKYKSHLYDYDEQIRLQGEAAKA